MTSRAAWWSLERIAAVSVVVSTQTRKLLGEANRMLQRRERSRMFVKCEPVRISAPNSCSYVEA